MKPDYLKTPILLPKKKLSSGCWRCNHEPYEGFDPSQGFQLFGHSKKLPNYLIRPHQIRPHQKMSFQTIVFLSEICPFSLSLKRRYSWNQYIFLSPSNFIPSQTSDSLPSVIGDVQKTRIVAKMYWPTDGVNRNGTYIFWFVFLFSYKLYNYWKNTWRIHNNLYDMYYIFIRFSHNIGILNELCLDFARQPPGHWAKSKWHDTNDFWSYHSKYAQIN